MAQFENEQLLSQLSDRINSIAEYTVEKALKDSSIQLSSSLNEAISRSVLLFSEMEITNEFGLPGGTFMPDPPEWWVKFIKSCSLDKISRDWDNIVDDLDNGWRWEKTALFRMTRINLTATGGKNGLHRPESTREDIPSINVDVVLNLLVVKKKIFQSLW